MDERQQTAAKRIFDLIPIWDRPDGSYRKNYEEEQINNIYNEISADPVSTINFLLDMIDELNA